MKITLFCIPLLLVVASNAAPAHVFLDHADPRVGSELARSPRQVSVWFTGDVEPAFSTLEVFTADDKQVDNKDTHRDAADKTLLTVSLPDLPAGAYKVIWHATATDTHRTQGSFKFTVKD